MTDGDEVSVCAEGENWMANAKEQQGYVKVLTFSLFDMMLGLFLFGKVLNLACCLGKPSIVKKKDFL